MDWNESYIVISICGNLAIIVLFLSDFFKEKIRFNLTFITLLYISILVSLRDEKVALDTPKYVELFLKGGAAEFYSEGVYELGFILLNKLIRLYTSNYHIFLFVVSFTHLFLILFLYRKLSKNRYSLLLSMYIASFTFWLSNLSMLRQGLAIPFLNLSTYYLVHEKNYKKFLIFSSIAGNIHYSAFILAIFIFILYKILDILNTKILKIILLIAVLSIIYPANIYMYVILKLISFLSKYIYTSPIINKIVWYFNWNKLVLWRIKHVYFLAIPLLFFSGVIYKRKGNFLLATLPLLVLSIVKYDEMVTDRIFMYFIPFIPYLILKNYELIKDNKIKLIFIIILFMGTLIWFNVKFLYLQYPGWFIYPYPGVR